MRHDPNVARRQYTLAASASLNMHPSPSLSNGFRLQRIALARKAG